MALASVDRRDASTIRRANFFSSEKLWTVWNVADSVTVRMEQASNNFGNCSTLEVGTNDDIRNYLNEIARGSVEGIRAHDLLEGL